MLSQIVFKLLIISGLFSLPYLVISHKLSLRDLLTTPTTTPNLTLGVVAQQRNCYGNYAKRNCGFKA